MADQLARLHAALAGRYAIERELGRGGMATVYLARDLKHHRQVAIKVLKPELAAALGPERFLREIEIAAQLSHPHILPLLDSGEADGLLFYLMPYVEGESLRGRLEREKQLPLEDALQIMGEVADALSYAHRHDVVHRDVKPENILFEAGHAVVSDFGIARAITAAAGDELTQTGIAIGTPGYMSPEQAVGSKELDGRSDIYSLGCVLYEMLAGEPPYAGPNARAVIAKSWSEPVPRLRTLREVPEAVEHAVTKALAKAPADRFATAARFREALASAGRVGMRPARERGGPTVRRLVYLLPVVATVAAIAAYTFLSRSPVRQRTTRGHPRTMLVVLPFENLGRPEDEYFADGITEEITSRLAQLSELGVIARTSAIQYKKTTKTVPEIGAELGVQYLLEGTVRWEKTPGAPSQVRVSPQLIRVSDATHVWAQPFQAALRDVFQLQADIAERVAEAMSTTLLAPERAMLAARPTENLDAYDYYLRGNDYATRDVAEDDARRAERMYEQAVALDSSFALAYAALARSRLTLYWVWARAEELPRAKVAVDRARQLAPDLAATHLALGYYAYYGSRDYARALQQFTLAEDRQPNNADALASKSFIERRVGQWERHVADLTRALELSPRSLAWISNLGSSYLYLRRYAEAERALNRAISLAPNIPELYAEKSVLYLNWVGDTTRARSVLEGAARTIDPAQAILADGWGNLARVFAAAFTKPILNLTLRTPDIDTLQYFFTKAELYTSTGQLPLARAYFDSARVWCEQRLRTDPGRTQYAHNWYSFLGMAYARLGQKEPATRAARRGVELLPVSKDAFSGPDRREQLAEVYAMTGDYAAALDELEFLLSIPSRVSVPLLHVDPIWQPLRNQPRFQRLLEQH